MMIGVLTAISSTLVLAFCLSILPETIEGQRLHEWARQSFTDMSNDERLRMPKERGPGDHCGLRVLLVQTDTRRLTKSKSYFSSTALLLSHYAKRHGYDYLKLTPDINDLFSQYKRFFCEKNPFSSLMDDCSHELDGNDQKYGKTTFHPGLVQFRASSWAKLPLVWYATKVHGNKYDYIWFFDSDATINPTYGNRSLCDALDLFSEKDKVLWGPTYLREASMVFFSNFPWRSDMPCAGNFFFKPSAGEQMLREWWDFNLPIRNMYDFMEQDALWLQLQAVDTGFRGGFSINQSSTTLLKERQLISYEYTSLNDLWLVHAPNYIKDREKYFATMLGWVGLGSEEAYGAAIEKLKQQNEFLVNMFSVVVAMDRCSAVEAEGNLRYVGVGEDGTSTGGIFECAKDPLFDVDATSDYIRPTPRRTDYPQIVNEKLFNFAVTPKDPYMTAAHRYEGLLVVDKLAKPDEVSLVQGGKRRPFANMDVLTSYGYTMDMVFELELPTIDKELPFGEPLPGKIQTGRKLKSYVGTEAEGKSMPP
jgi:hypothetical protein